VRRRCRTLERRSNKPALVGNPVVAGDIGEQVSASRMDSQGFRDRSRLLSAHWRDRGSARPSPRFSPYRLSQGRIELSTHALDGLRIMILFSLRNRSVAFGKDDQGQFLPFPGTNLTPKQNGVRRRGLLLSGWAPVTAVSCAASNTAFIDFQRRRRYRPW
jgi:hypothetical protein